jgi:hypothetical protein
MLRCHSDVSTVVRLDRVVKDSSCFHVARIIVSDDPALQTQKLTYTS